MNKTNIKKHLRRAFAALVAVGALLALPLADASPGAASGTVSGCAPLPDVSYRGNLEIDTGSVTQTFTGTFTGTLVATETDIITPHGEDIASFSGVFTGMVAGSPIGTAVLTGTGIGTPGRLSLQMIVGQGTGGLAGLHANLTYSLPTLVCDPSTPCPPPCAFEFTADYGGLFQFAP